MLSSAWTCRSAAAVGVLAALAATPVVTAAPAPSDCGDPDQLACTGTVPTTEQVLAVLAELTDPSKPAADKADVVTPGFAPDEAGTIDDHLNRMNGPQFALVPPNFVVTNIRPSPNNAAGATVATTGGYRRATNARPIVLVNQGGHWSITHDTAMDELDALWNAAERRNGGCAPLIRCGIVK